MAPSPGSSSDGNKTSYTLSEHTAEADTSTSQGSGVPSGNDNSTRPSFTWTAELRPQVLERAYWQHTANQHYVLDQAFLVVSFFLVMLPFYTWWGRISFYKLCPGFGGAGALLCQAYYMKYHRHSYDNHRQHVLVVVWVVRWIVLGSIFWQYREVSVLAPLLTGAPWLARVKLFGISNGALHAFLHCLGYQVQFKKRLAVQLWVTLLVLAMLTPTVVQVLSAPAHCERMLSVYDQAHVIVRQLHYVFTSGLLPFTCPIHQTYGMAILFLMTQL